MDRGAPSPRTDLSTLTTAALLRRIHREDRRVLPAVGRALPQIARAVDVVVEALRGGGRLIYVGAGTSGRIALLDALEIPPTFGLSPQSVQAIVPKGAAREDDAALGRVEIRRRRVGRRDVVIGIAASGSTPFTLAALAEARRRGARTIALTTMPGSPLAAQAELAIVPVVGEEVIRGSTRMKAGTAQKLILNMISTAAMARLGHVYGDLMVGVRPLNEKLRRRATSIVASAAGVSTARAARALRAVGGEIKVAVVMLRAGVTAAAARRRLAAAGGVVGAALGVTGRKARRAPLS